jgi:hypothetical protein
LLAFTNEKFSSFYSHIKNCLLSSLHLHTLLVLSDAFLERKREREKERKREREKESKERKQVCFSELRVGKGFFPTFFYSL